MNRPTTPPLELQALLDELRRAGTDARPDVLQSWLQRLRAMARQHLPNQSPLRAGFDSEDLLQDGLLQLVRTVDQFRGASWPAFLAFVHAILEQKKLQQVRRHAVRAKELAPIAESASLPAEQGTPSVDAVAAEDRQHVRKLVDGLPEPYRATMLLRLQGLGDHGKAARCSA